MLEKITILGANINKIAFNQALLLINDWCSNTKQHHIITANPEIILQAKNNPDYQNLINRSDLVLSDGIGLLWAAKFLSLKSESLFGLFFQILISGLSIIIYPDYVKEVLPERITGVDLMEKICETADKKIFLLGGGPGIAEKTADTLQKKYIKLKIAGADSGPPPKLWTKDYQIEKQFNVNELIDKINSSGAEILFVAFGAPKQDFFISNYLSKMANLKLAMGVGGAFDFIAGNIKRAPKIYRDLGLEWLFRFFQQPWRAIRIFNATCIFVYNILKFKYINK